MTAKTQLTIGRLLSRLIGISLVLASIILAISIRFGHFYELLIVGLFLALCSTTSLSISRMTYVYMYVFFMGSGFIGDYVMGIHQGKLWYYPSFHAPDFAVLYGIGYPLAGIVMVQSYFFALHVLAKKRSTPKTLSAPHIGVHIVLTCLFFTAFIGITAGAIAKPTPFRSSLSYLSSALLGTALLSLITAYRKHPTILELFRKQPASALFALLLSTYCNALLQEFPNTYAHEWVYTHYPLAGIKIFAIPCTILGTWPILVIFPLAVYYLVVSDRATLYSQD